MVKSPNKPDLFQYLLTFLLISLFLGLTFYNISSSLFFQNDIGRDFLVLYDWSTTGKIPLLGPQNSAIPFNQSAVYFYLLYPFFLLSKMSYFSTLFANAFIYLFCLLFGLKIAQEVKLKYSYLAVFGLMILHPLIIGQNRYVWNPSLVPPFLMLAILGYILLLKGWAYPRLLVLSISLALAVSMSYSVIPVFMMMGVLAVATNRKYWWQVITAFLASLLLVNLPTVIFELRHSFLLTSSLIHGTITSGQSMSFSDNLQALLNYGFYGDRFNNLMLTIFLMSLAYTIYLIQQRDQVKLRLSLLILFIGSLVIYLLQPVGLKDYYLLGLLVEAMFIIGSLPRKVFWPICLVYAGIWIQSGNINKYFYPAIRTVDQLDSCFVQVCQQIKEPVFLTVQASFHPYHVGPEFRYIAKKQGCDVKYLETDPAGASKMIVVADQSTYQSGKTDYLELRQFGPATLEKTISCQGNVNVSLIKKTL